MKYYVFTTEQDALDYDIEATAKHKFVTTQNWSTPIKHPTLNKWAVVVSPKHIIQGKTSQALTKTWFAE